MRKLFIGLAAIVLLLAATPFVMGFIVKSDVENIIAHMNQSPEMNLVVKNYHRGWLHSSADIDIQFNLNSSRNGDASFTLKENIAHGPIIFKNGQLIFGRALIQTDVILPGKAKSNLNKLFADQKSTPSLTNKTILTLTGAMKTQLEIPNYTFVKPNQGKVTWQGLTGVWTLSSDFMRYTGNVQLDGVDVDSPMLKAKVGKTEMRYGGSATDISNYQTEFFFNQPLVDVMTMGQPMFNLTNFQVESQTKVVKDMLSQDFSSELGQLNVRGQQYGPGSLMLNISRVNAKPLVELQQQVEKMQMNRQISPKQQGAAMAMMLVGTVPKLFIHGPQIVLQKLQLKVPEGLIKANATVNFKPIEKGAAANPMMVMQASKDLNMNAQVQMPVALMRKALFQYAMTNIVRQQHIMAMLAKHKAQQEQSAAAHGNNNGEHQTAQTPEFKPLTRDELIAKADESVNAQLKLWEDRSYIEKQGDDYLIKAEMKNGQMMLNGKVIKP